MQPDGGSIGPSERVRHSWLLLNDFLKSPAALVLAALWAVFSFEQNRSDQLQIEKERAANEAQIADRTRDTEHLKLMIDSIDGLTCSDDKHALERQYLLGRFIAQGAARYSALIAEQFEHCARTPEQKAAAKDYRDYSNNLDLMDQFSGFLKSAQTRYDLGLRDVESLGIFERAYSALPATYGDRVDRPAMESARKAMNAKHYDEAAAYYMKAFSSFDSAGYGTNSMNGYSTSK
jgi:hypothetical protein